MTQDLVAQAGPALPHITSQHGYRSFVTQDLVTLAGPALPHITSQHSCRSSVTQDLVELAGPALQHVTHSISLYLFKNINVKNCGSDTS